MLRWWPVALVVVLQLGALALMPRRSASALASGTEITLRTRAVDPFDPLAGRYVVLAYEAEQAPPSPDVSVLEKGAEVWLIVGRDPSGPDAELWKGVSIETAPVRPTPSVRALRAIWSGSRAELVGAGRLYMTEEKCLAVDAIAWDRWDEGEVDLALDEHGNVSPRRLRVDGRVFEP